MPYILCGESVTNLRREADHWILNNEIEAKEVINTTPWNDLYKALGEPIELKRHFDRIKYNKIVISLYEKEYEHNWHRRYIPDRNKPWHREFYIRNFIASSRAGGIYTVTNINRFVRGENVLFGEHKADYYTDAAYPIPLL